MKLLVFSICCFLAVTRVFSETFRVTIHFLTPSEGDCRFLISNDDLCKTDFDVSTCTRNDVPTLIAVIKNYIKNYITDVR